MKRGKGNNRVFASEKKYRAKLVKGKHGWLIKGMVFSALILGGTFATTTSVDASEWQANSVEQIASRIKPGQTSITMELGDTVYNIGLAINIKDPMKLLFDNGFSHGEQYTLPVGTVISWDGNHVTVKDPNGNIIGDKIVSDDEKHDSSKTIAGQTTDTPQNSGSNTSSTHGNKVPNTRQSNQGSVNTNQTNGQGSTKGSDNQNTPSTPSEPNKPTEPTNSSEPTDPVKPTDPAKPVDPTPTDPETPSLTELEKLKQQLSDLQQKLAVAEQELASAVQELETAKNLIGTNLDDQIIALQNEIAQKEAKQSTTQANVNEAQSKVDNLTGEVATAQQKTATAQAEVDQWTSQAAAAQQQVNAAQTEIDAATASGDADALAAAQQKQAAAQSQLDSAAANQLQKEAELALAQADQIAKQDQLANAQQELATATDQLSANDTTADKQKLQELQEQKNKQDEIKNSIIELEKKVEEKQKVVDDLKNQIKETEKQIADIELKVTREQAVAQVNQLEYLTNDLKNGYISRINSSLSASEISSIVGEAQAKNAELKVQYEAEQAAKKLVEAKTSAKSTIDSMNLTSDEKSSYKSKVDAATTIEGVQSVVNEAQAKSDENDQKEEDAKKLAEAKKNAKTSIDSMNLTNDEKSSYKSKVDAATTTEGVQSAVNEAKATSDKNDQKEALEKAKKSAKTQIDGMNLTNDEKTSFKSKVDTATSIDEVTNVINEALVISDENDAKEQDAKKLAEAKEKAITKINSMNLKDQKQSFVDQINAAQSESVVDRVVEEAQKVSDKNDQDEQDAKELATAKINALAELEGMNLKDQLESFKSQVNSATTVKQVNDIMSAAQTVSDENDVKDQDAKELAEAKTTALGQIDKMNLKDQKQSFVDRVNAAKTKAEVNKVVEDAQKVSDENDQKDQDAKELAEVKETALAKLEKMNLKDKLSEFKSKVNAATSTSAIDQIVKDAQQVSDENDQKDADSKSLDVIRENMINRLNSMELTSTQLNDFMNQINKADSIEKIQSIIDQAMKTSNENIKSKSYQNFKQIDKQKVKEEADKIKETIPNVNAKDSYKGYESIDSLLSQSDAKTEEALNKIKNASDSTKVIIPQEDYDALRPYLELNKRYTARMYENINNLRKSLGLKPLAYVEMTDKEAALMLAHAYASSVAGDHTLSIANGRIISENSTNSGNAENLGPNQSIAVYEKITSYENVTPETMADSMFRKILGEGDAYVSGQGESGHLRNILSTDVSQIMFGGVWFEGVDNLNAGMFGQGKQYRYTNVEIFC